MKAIKSICPHPSFSKLESKLHYETNMTIFNLNLTHSSMIKILLCDSISLY